MRRILLPLFCLVPLLALAQDKKDEPKKVEEKLPRIAINDPAKLKDNKEFLTQGEFEMKRGDGKFALQAIARGDGKYGIVNYAGGLPGDGWDEVYAENIPVVKTKDGKVVFVEQTEDGKILGSEINENGIIVTDGKNEVTFKRTSRKSPTLGAKPPPEAVVLFDKPEDLANWEKCSVVELSDGKFLGVGGRSKQKFQSFTLHLEFRLPWMPNSTGQARGNSGVYIQDRYELQVLDSFGLKGENNECGGIYQQAVPKVNMCFPPMTWQTYDIDFTAATFEDGKKTKNAVMTIKHNGVVIHDKFEPQTNCPGGGVKTECAEPGALYLQDHKDPVVYRNIWIVEKK